MKDIGITFFKKILSLTIWLWIGLMPLKTGKENIDFSFECFLKKFNLILDKYLPLKKLTKQKLKFKTKPWITPGLQKSITIKNKLLTDIIKLKGPVLKNEAYDKYKIYRNMLPTLLKRSKHISHLFFKTILMIEKYLEGHKNSNFFERLFIYSPIHYY